MDHGDVNRKARENGEGDASKTSVPTVVNPIPVYAITVFFYAIFFGFFPLLWQNQGYFWNFLVALVFFIVLIPVITWILGRFAFYQQQPERKQKEILNRIISIVFNVIVTTPANDLYYESGLFSLPPLRHLLTGNVKLMEFFCGTSMGYVVYDFTYLVLVYHETSAAILLHHCCEMLILSTYLYNPALGGTYTVYGGLMMVSSVLLHVQRICYLAKSNSQIMFAIKMVLLFTWVMGRLVAAPHLVYLAITHIPMTPVHVLMLVASVALLLMNVIWAWRIYKRVDLKW